MRAFWRRQWRETKPVLGTLGSLVILVLLCVIDVYWGTHFTTWIPAGPANIGMLAAAVVAASMGFIVDVLRALVHQLRFDKHVRDAVALIPDEIRHRLRRKR